MKKIIFSVMLAMASLSFVVADADAKRLGGGGSFGKQSQPINRSAPTAAPSQAAKPAAPAAAPAPAVKPPSPWRGILGGALLGLGLGALMSHFGLGGALGGMLGSLLMVALLAGAVFFIVRMFRNKNTPQTPAFAGSGASAYSAEPQEQATPMHTPAYAPEIGSRIEPSSPSTSANMAMTATPFGVPADFDTQGFLRHAKTYFIRLQAAWDKADINDIREFSTPEMFAELRMQLQERGASANVTDVMTLEAELLGIETASEHYLASVKFSGMIKEAANAPVEPFSEIWNLLKPTTGPGGWVLAGIQQLP
jgi:predicted lipid-binding transport protein (Tim44 family)